MVSFAVRLIRSDHDRFISKFASMATSAESSYRFWAAGATALPRHGGCFGSACWRTDMAETDPNSVAALIRGLLDDTRDLIREEIALARAEIREEITAA